MFITEIDENDYNPFARSTRKGNPINPNKLITNHNSRELIA